MSHKSPQNEPTNTFHQLVAVTAEFLVGSIDDVTEKGGISKEWVGLILLPIVGNAAGIIDTSFVRHIIINPSRACDRCHRISEGQVDPQLRGSCRLKYCEL